MSLNLAPGSSRIALVVHARSDLREIYAANLKSAGFTVDQGTSGIHAIERAASLLPDVVVLDLELDDFDGWQVCRLLKSGKGTRAIPVVVMVPGRVVHAVHRARDAGCDVALAKPVSPETLLRAVERLLGRRSPLGFPQRRASARRLH